MTRPHIIRADTIDLQSTNAPSAKDHSRQPTHPAPLGDGPPAPHQAVALKQAEQDVEFHPRSPRMSLDLSNKELQLLHDDTESIDSTNATGPDHESHSLHRNGGLNGGIGEGTDGDDGSGDDGSEDDMMDKISSSPSIDDANDTPSSLSEYGPVSVYPSVSRNSPPYSYPQEDPDPGPSEDHHREGEYTEDRHGSKYYSCGDPEDRITTISTVQDEFDNTDEDDMYLYENDFTASDFHHLLVPADDPILDNSFDNAPLSPPWTCSPPLSMSPSEDEAMSVSDDESEDFSYSNSSRFIDSGWGGECLREIEDIDFDFVYALHTFIATVEGQANSTKGDTMVLLDDSNSYWWLVRVVKDGSIGYLPAEHIETPTERLARLNKHRNIDLSQAMLGDNQEKAKNPLKKAMRRRNGKTVQFAPPTYVEPPDIDYSTEEEDDSDGEYNTRAEESADGRDGDQDVDRDETAAVEPLNSKSQGVDIDAIDETQGTGDAQVNDLQRTTSESERVSEEAFERSDDATAPGRSRKGTVRNTDSFFRDENTETRKINLTPSLLRDDSSGSTTKSLDAKEQYTRGSLDSLEKPQSSEKGKEDKKRKEKKGMLGGLFKRKDKKTKGHEEDVEDSKRSLEEPSRESPQPKESLESLAHDSQKSTLQSAPQRQTSKLQKTPPPKISTGANTPVSRLEPVSPISTPQEQQNHMVPPPTRPPPSTEIAEVGSAPASHRGKAERSRLEPTGDSALSPEETAYIETPYDQRQGMLSPLRESILSSSRSGTKPEAVKAAQHRMALDDFDSSPEPEERADPLHLSSAPNPASVTAANSKENLSDSPVETTQPDQVRIQDPPGLVVDSSSQEEPTILPSPASSGELVEAPRNQNERETTPSAAESSRNAHTWSDANLRAYLENDTDIRDLLLLIKDKSDMKPPSRNHPLVKDLFKDENRKLEEISNELDNLLEDFLARRSKARREKTLQSTSQPQF